MGHREGKERLVSEPTVRLQYGAMLALGLFGCSMILNTEMGGIPERAADGGLILNNHGIISPAGHTGWWIARTLHWTGFASAALTLILLGMAIWHAKPRVPMLASSPSGQRIGVAFVLTITTVFVFAVVISVTPWAKYLAAL